MPAGTSPAGDLRKGSSEAIRTFVHNNNGFYTQKTHEIVSELARQGATPLVVAEDTKVLFLGQQVASENFYGTLEEIPLERRLEMPVAEELQMGMSIGMSLLGYLPIV